MGKRKVVLHDELRTRSKAVHDVFGVGFVFLGQGDRVPGEAQQEWKSGRHEELQPGQYDENRLSTHTGRDLQHETTDASESHTVRHVFLGQESAVRGVSLDGLRFVSGFVTEPFCRGITRNGYSVRAQGRPARTRIHTQQKTHTQVCQV